MFADAFLKEKNMKKYLDRFTLTEKILWTSSVLLIVISFILFDRTNYLTLAASLIGVTSLIYNAKGDPAGQIMMIVFSLLYGVISYSFAYYGEMITYLGMTMPMAVIALVSWLRHPYKGSRSQVEVSSVGKKEWVLIICLTAAVTAGMYFVLGIFHTAYLPVSTLSVTTSFVAAYLTFRRSPYFALAYAANDCVLIVLWILASIEDIRYISVTVCFVAFLFNDVYGFINWRSMKKRQSADRRAPGQESAE